MKSKQRDFCPIRNTATRGPLLSRTLIAVQLKLAQVAPACTMPVARRYPYRGLITPDEEQHESSTVETSVTFGLDEVRTGLIWPTARSSVGMSAAARPPAPTATAFRDVGTLVRVFFIHGLFVRQRWMFPLLLAICAGAYEAAAATVMDVIGDFYFAISSMQADLFLRVGLKRNTERNDKGSE